MLVFPVAFSLLPKWDSVSAVLFYCSNSNCACILLLFSLKCGRPVPFPLGFAEPPVRGLVPLQGYCNFLELCSTSPPLPYSHVSNPHFTYSFNYIIHLKNLFLGSPVRLHQVQACLSCFKTSLALSPLWFLTGLLPLFKSIQMCL